MFILVWSLRSFPLGEEESFLKGLPKNKDRKAGFLDMWILIFLTQALLICAGPHLIESSSYFSFS